MAARTLEPARAVVARAGTLTDDERERLDDAWFGNLGFDREHAWAAAWDAAIAAGREDDWFDVWIEADDLGGDAARDAAVATLVEDLVATPPAGCPLTAFEVGVLRAPWANVVGATWRRDNGPPSPAGS